MSPNTSIDELTLGRLLGDKYNPQQPEFILDPAFEVCWVGGLGCGKTYAGCVAALRHGAKYGAGARVLIGRRTFREIEGSIKQDFFDLVRGKDLQGLFERPATWDYREGTNLARMRNGAEFMFGNLETVDKLKNFQWSAAVIDQLEEIPWEIYQMLLQRVRWTGVPGEDRHVWSIANDEGDNWIRRRFLTYEAPHGRPSKGAGRKLIRGKSFDNPHLDETARAVLLGLPPEIQARWIYAEMQAGASRLLPNWRVIPPVQVPSHWPRWLGVDPARSTGVTCAVWTTVNPDDKALGAIPPNAPHIYQEYWAEGREAEIHADEINRLTGPYPMRAQVMDHSAWHSVLKSRKFGSVSVADLYIKAGLPVAPSQGDEWARVLLFLEAHKRGLTIAETCTNLIRQGPEYRIKGQTGPGGIVRISGKQAFHAVDAGGYALSLIPTRVAPVDVRELRPFFDIAEGVDDFSRRHWEQELRSLPMRRGRESVVTQGFDEAEMHAEATSLPRDTPPSDTEDLWA